MDKKFRVGLVGSGDISDIYCSNGKKYDFLEITACASRRIEHAQAKAAKHGIAKACTVDELMADTAIDAVLNLTLPEAHAEISRKALLAGKHVYTEKPVAATLEGGRELLDLASRRGLRIGSAPDTFLGGRLQTCRRAIDEGRIGQLIGASAFVPSPGHEWHHPNPAFFYTFGGGPILDIAPYYLTALVALMGPVTRACGMGGRYFSERTVHLGPQAGQTVPVEVLTHINGIMHFANGAIGTIFASFDVWDSQLPRIEIYGTKGTLCLPETDPILGPNIFGGEVLLKTDQTARWRGIPRPTGFENWESLPIRHGYIENSRGIGLADMALAIRENRPHRASAEMAFHVLEIGHAILSSCESGQFVDLASRCERPAPLPELFP